MGPRVLRFAYFSLQKTSYGVGGVVSNFWFFLRRTPPRFAELNGKNSSTGIMRH